MNATENTTKKYITEYYKTTIDVITSWLLFQNSFEQLSTKSFLVVAPMLEATKHQIYEELENLTIMKTSQFSISKIKDIIKNLMEERLRKNGLEELIINQKKISEEKIIELSTALYIKRCLFDTLKDIEFIDEINPKDDNVKFLLTYLKELKKLRLQNGMEHKEYSEPTIRFYIESLGIEYNKDTTSYAYSYKVLFYIKKCEHLIGEILKSYDYENEYEDTSEDIEILSNEIDDYMKVDSLWSLIITFHIFNHHLKTLKEKVKTKENILQKAVKSNN